LIDFTTGFSSIEAVLLTVCILKQEFGDESLSASFLFKNLCFYYFL